MGELGTVGSDIGGSTAYMVTGYTAINEYAGQYKGMVKTVDLRVRTAGTFKIKIFHYVAPNFVFIAETSHYFDAGLQLGIPITLPIEKDYLIGNYSADGTTYCSDGGTGSLHRKLGDIVTTTPLSEWGFYINNLNIVGHIFGRDFGCVV